MTIKRKNYNTTLRTDLIKRLKILSAEQDLRANDLLEKAIKDLLKKYGKKVKEQSLTEGAMDRISRPHFSNREVGFYSLSTRFAK